MNPAARRVAGAVFGCAAGTLAGLPVGFLGGAALLAVVATIRMESFDGMGLLAFGAFGAPIGGLAGAIAGIVVGSRMVARRRAPDDDAGPQ